MNSSWQYFYIFLKIHLLSVIFKNSKGILLVNIRRKLNIFSDYLVRVLQYIIFEQITTI